MMTPTWLQTLLDCEKTTDICIQGSAEIFVDRGSGMERIEGQAWSVNESRAWIVDQLSKAGRSWDAKYPFADSFLSSGHRLHAVFPPISGEFPALSLRRTALCAQNPDTQGAWKAQPGYELLREAVLKHQSILVAGATGSGKTTLLNTLIGECLPSERLLLLEDVPELKPSHPHALRLSARPATADGVGEVTLRTLLRQSLRMRPDRLIIGECRGPEVLDLLQALNTGHQGTLATVHAASARDALRRLELLCLLSPGQPLATAVIRDLISSGIQWIVHLDRTSEGRRMSEIARVSGREGDTILLRPMLASTHGPHGIERTPLVNAYGRQSPRENRARENGPTRVS